MTASIRFNLKIPNPDDHLLHVEMAVFGLNDDAQVALRLPVWTPGSYMVREYSQFVQDVVAHDSDGRRLDVWKSDKASWRIACHAATAIRVSYTVYAYELNSRFSHVDRSHAFLHGPSIFMYPDGRKGERVEVEVEIPQGWSAFTGLDPVEHSQSRFVATDFDELYDCPIELGPHEAIEFEAQDAPHQFIFWGRGDYDAEAIARDVPKIIDASTDVFGTLPYERFLFLCHLTEGATGGLEHRNSTALMYPRHRFGRVPDADEDDEYLDFLTLVSHEHFHAWNIKKIRPERLGPFDYQNENYTRDLWTVEGITSYYQNLVLQRAGLISTKRFLELIGKQLKALGEIPGRLVSSLEDASFDAWIGLYRPHPHKRNNTVSYYLKGALAAFALDATIRVESDGAKTLDDVMRYLWTHYSRDEGYPEGAYESIVAEVVGNDLTEFFDVFVRGKADPDWNDWLENIGLEVVAETAPDASAHLGITCHGTEIAYVEAGSTAERGLYPGDRIIAIDGLEARDSNLERLLSRHEPGDEVALHLFRRGELVAVTVSLEAPRPSKVTVRHRTDATDRATELLVEWLGETALEDSNADS